MWSDFSGFADPLPDVRRMKKTGSSGLRHRTPSGWIANYDRASNYGSLLNSVNTFCGIMFACESIAVPACWTISAWVRFEVAWA